MKEKKETRRLLIISCSSRKLAETQGAFDLYDGTAWRTMKKVGLDPHILGVEVLILSAEHGLIGCRQRIENYDRRMNKDRARELAAETRARFRGMIQMQRDFDMPDYSEIFIYAGADYMLALGTVAEIEQASGARVRRAGGRGCGDMMAQLKQWLEAIQAERRAEFAEIIAARKAA